MQNTNNKKKKLHNKNMRKKRLKHENNNTPLNGTLKNFHI